MNPKKLVKIFGLNYAPEPTGNAPYTTGLAEFLAAAGYEVEVVTGQPHYPQWRRYKDSLDRGRPGLRVRRLNHYVPKSPRIVGRLLMEASYAVQLLPLRGRADLYITVSPSLLGSVAIALKSTLTRTPSVLWVQDIYSRGIREALDGGGIVAKAVERLEAFAFNHSGSIIAAHEGFVDAIGALTKHGVKVHVVHNWSHVNANSAYPAPDMPRIDFLKTSGAADGSLVVVHAGNIGAKQGLENIVATARAAHASNLDIHFVLLGDGNERDRLEQLAENLPNLTFVDPLPAELLIPFLNACDFLLVNEKVGVREMSIPSKLTTYWSTMSPVICCVDEAGLTAREVLGAGGGVIVPAGRPDALIAAIVQLRHDEKARRELVQNGQQYRIAHLDSRAALRSMSEIFDGVTKK